MIPATPTAYPGNNMETSSYERSSPNPIPTSTSSPQPSQRVQTNQSTTHTSTLISYSTVPPLALTPQSTTPLIPTILVPSATSGSYATETDWSSTSVHSSKQTGVNSSRSLRLSSGVVAAIVGVASILAFGIIAGLLVRSRRRRKRNEGMKAEDMEALAGARASTIEAQLGVGLGGGSQNVQAVPGTCDDKHRPIEAGTTEAVFGFRSPSHDDDSEQREDWEFASAAPDHHPQPSSETQCPNASRAALNDHHESDLDYLSFHTTRASSSRPNSLTPRPLPPIPPSSVRPHSDATIGPVGWPAPIVTDFRREAETDAEMAVRTEELRPSDTEDFRREIVRHRGSRTGLSTAHSQSSMFSFPPPSYSSARPPTYHLPDEEVPPLPNQYRAGGGDSDHDPGSDDHLPA